MIGFKAAFFDADGTLWRRNDNKYCITSVMSNVELARNIEGGSIIPTNGIKDFLQFLALSNVRIVLVSENYWKLVTLILEHPRIALDRFFKQSYDEKSEYESERIYLMPYNSIGCFTKPECVRHYLKSYNIPPNEAFFVDNEVRDLKSLQTIIPELKTILIRTESREKWTDSFDSFEELLQHFSRQIP